MIIDILFGAILGAGATYVWAKIDQNRRRAKSAEFSVGDTGNQLRFVEQVDLQTTRPINKEAFRKFRVAEELLASEKQNWRIFAEVGLGAFVQTSRKSGTESQRKRAFKSYNSKRVDFLIIDSLGNAAVAMEYQGSGHHMSSDAAARDAVKKRVLQRADVELVEVSSYTTDDELRTSLAAALQRHRQKRQGYAKS
ncbi:DUF2726 domain-containing protein [Thioclava litoralis]|uniref:DUF2726 domain-containing protein n=1 Tax=Thioclava litoralis TaxID=3076557 RepID=A0ABZ1DW29_9RHOB|nr:DUF2726 domain-containing protein [Thioclava sp. FTW29]